MSVKRCTMIALSLVLSSINGPMGQAAPTPAPAALPARPPQYVVVSFDGSKTLNMWEQTLALARRVNAHFTYFVSGVYFLANENRNLYTGPGHRQGRSDIGFGGEALDLEKRVDFLNLAQASGDEIGSHANGHFDGSRWSADEWLREFKEFNDFIFNVARLNHLGGRGEVQFAPARVHGFRAPLLATGAGLETALRLPEISMGQHYTYDASNVAPPGYWPEKINGIWNFPLPQVTLAGTAKRTIAMDYNMFFTQTALFYQHPTDNTWSPKDVPESATAAVQKQVFDTYMNHFRAQYYGNRAPVIFGNHFSTWNHGVYWNALIEFAQTVCSEPEVRCVSAEELEGKLEELAKTPGLVQNYRRGHFTKSGLPQLNFREVSAQELQAELKLQLDEENKIALVMTGRHANFLSDAGKVHWSLDNQALPHTSDGRPALPKTLKVGELHILSAAIHVNHQEVARTTRLLKILPVEKGGSQLTLGEKDLELNSTLGELPGAHAHEE